MVDPREIDRHAHGWLAASEPGEELRFDLGLRHRVDGAVEDGAHAIALPKFVKKDLEAIGSRTGARATTSRLPLLTQSGLFRLGWRHPRSWARGTLSPRATTQAPLALLATWRLSVPAASPRRGSR